MSANIDVDRGTLATVSGELRQGADALAAEIHPPEAIKAGRLTAMLAALGGHLAGESEKLTAHMQGAADAVTTSADSYTQVDDGAKRTLRPESEKPGYVPPPVPPGGV